MELKSYKRYKVRPETSDLEMIKQCEKNYSDFDLDSNSVVMDFGMNIGGFGGMCITKGVKSYIGVEPHPDNFQLAKLNLEERDDFVLLEGAVTSLKASELILSLTDAKQKHCSGTTLLKSSAASSMRKERITVKAYNVFELLETYKPTHLKIDIEGEEWRILADMDYQIPGYVKQIAFEFHWPERILTYEADVRVKFLNQGFVPVKEDLNYVKGDKKFTFIGKEVGYRNIWGLETLYKR